MLVFTKRQRALLEIQRRRNDRSTYVTPLPPDSSEEFDDDIPPQSELNAELQMYDATLKVFYEELVPSVVSEEEFWQRYFYRTGSLDRVVDELTLANDGPWNASRQVATPKDSAKDAKRKDNSCDTTKLKEENCSDICSDKDRMMQRIASSEQRRPRESLGPASLFAFVLPQMSQIHTELPDLQVAATADSQDEESKTTEETKVVEPAVEPICTKLEVEHTEGSEKEDASPIAVAWKAMFGGANKRRAQSLGADANPKRCPSRASLSPTALRGMTLEQESNPAQDLEEDLPEEATPIMSVEVMDSLEDEHLFNDPPSPLQDAPTSPHQKPATEVPSVITLLLSLIILLIAYLSTEPDLTNYRHGLCAPYIPGLYLPGRTFAVEAPWWAPGWRDGFAHVCGGDPPTRLQWDETKAGVFRLTISTGRKKQTFKRLQSVRVLANKVVLEKHGGKIEDIPGPWTF